MVSQDLHIHTTYSDGDDTPEQMILAAIEAKMDTVGISDHSYTDFDLSCCIKKDCISRYISEINSLKDKYSGQINVLCGIEQDYYSGKPTEKFDYIIGSVHYIKVKGNFIPVDDNADILTDAIDRYFGGDVYALIEEYYKTEANVVKQTGADIIGHFDLIEKFNRKMNLFDQNHPRYISAWHLAADALLATGKPFEINVGAITRGYTSLPYPSSDICKYIIGHGGKMIFSSDSHSVEALNLSRKYVGLCTELTGTDTGILFKHF